MTDRDRDLLALRDIEIHAEMQAIAEGRVVDGDLALVECCLLDELEDIEYRLGEDYTARPLAGTTAGKCQ